LALFPTTTTSNSHRRFRSIDARGAKLAPRFVALETAWPTRRGGAA
jgi:hypothetical protein